MVHPLAVSACSAHCPAVHTRPLQLYTRAPKTHEIRSRVRNRKAEGGPLARFGTSAVRRLKGNACGLCARLPTGGSTIDQLCSVGSSFYGGGN